MGKLNYRIPNTNDFREIYVKVTDTLPIGAVCQYAGSTAPSGYLMCNGQAVSRTTYADLFKAIGTAFGTGDGVTTFNLPNFNGRVPVGLDGTDTDFDTLGETGGNKSVTLTDGNMPKNVELLKYVGAAASAWGLQINNTNYQVAATGQGTPINVMQPSLVINYIIKATKKVALDKGNVVDSLDGSDTDSAPSVRAVKEAFGGTVLWTNPNPNQAFSNQTINVDLSDYDCVEIYYKKGIDTGEQMIKAKIDGSISLFAFQYVDGSGDCMVVRPTVVGKTSIVFDHAYALGIGTNVNAGQNDATVIPTMIIGYKTGLFS